MREVKYEHMMYYLINRQEIKCASKKWYDKKHPSDFKFDIQIYNIKYQK